tara:strand:- start:200 stop:1483 length:1284 start_codon:yes stop_codon:yes gene_type:complete
MRHTDDCIAEIAALLKRLNKVKRQLLAQKEYIDKAIIDAKSAVYSISPNKPVDYRVKLYKHRNIIGRLKKPITSADDATIDEPGNNTIESKEAESRVVMRKKILHRGYKLETNNYVPIFQNDQVLSDLTSEYVAGTTEKKVFNGLDIVGAKQFFIGVNAILTHPNNISETLVPPSPYLNPAEEKRSYSTVWQDPPPHDVGKGWAQSMIDSERAWSAKTHPTLPALGRPFKKGDEWMKIELPSVKLVTGVVTQDTELPWYAWWAPQYVKTLTVKTSIDDVAPDANGNKLSLVDSGDIFVANTRYPPSTLKTIPFKQPVLAKYVIIYPQTYSVGPSMRAGVLVAPLEDTPYKSIGPTDDLREFNDGPNPYTPGLKHALSTGVLKGLLMQGNENITGTASYNTILTAIPTDGTDSNNKDHFKKIRGFGLD